MATQKYLIIEQNDFEIETIKPDKESVDYYIKGLFMEADKENKNNRKYPEQITESQVNAFQGLIKDNRSLGELGHPNTPKINLDMASHKITELIMERKQVFGKAKIMGTPRGQIVKNLIDENVKIGVSLRGLGSLKKIGNYDEVENDFELRTFDIVYDPSFGSCFVENLMEETEWIYQANGLFVQKGQQIIEEAFKPVQKPSKKEQEQIGLKLFEKFLNGLK
jgi:hypothetical protein